jgi:hypothetical protein
VRRRQDAQPSLGHSVVPFPLGPGLVGVLPLCKFFPILFFGGFLVLFRCLLFVVCYLLLK